MGLKEATLREDSWKRVLMSWMVKHVSCVQAKNMSRRLDVMMFDRYRTMKRIEENITGRSSLQALKRAVLAVMFVNRLKQSNTFKRPTYA